MGTGTPLPSADLPVSGLAPTSCLKSGPSLAPPPPVALPRKGTGVTSSGYLSEVQTRVSWAPEPEIHSFIHSADGFLGLKPGKIRVTTDLLTLFS